MVLYTNLISLSKTWSSTLCIFYFKKITISKFIILIENKELIRKTFLMCLLHKQDKYTKIQLLSKSFMYFSHINLWHFFSIGKSRENCELSDCWKWQTKFEEKLQVKTYPCKLLYLPDIPPNLSGKIKL